MIEVHVLTCAYLLWMLARRVQMQRKRGGTAALSCLFPRGRHPPMAPRRFLLESDDESAERACEPPEPPHPTILLHSAETVSLVHRISSRNPPPLPPPLIYSLIVFAPAASVYLSLETDRGVETLIGRNCSEYPSDVCLTLFHVSRSRCYLPTGYTRRDYFSTDIEFRGGI